MRQRGHFIGLWLNEREYQHLRRQCRASGLTASAFVRKSIQGEEIKPRPPETYAALLRELAAIGKPNCSFGQRQGKHRHGRGPGGN